MILTGVMQFYVVKVSFLAINRSCITALWPMAIHEQFTVKAFNFSTGSINHTST